MQADEKESTTDKHANEEQFQSSSSGEQVPGKTDQSESDYMQQQSTEPKKEAVLRWLNPNNLLVCLNIMIAAGIFYQAYFIGQSNKLTRQALSENATQFNSILQEIKEQTVAAQTAAAAAQAAATAASRSAEAAGRQVSATEEQTNTAIEALRLDQRAWLGYERYVIQARANDAPEWKEREPRAGDLLRGRLYIHNVGKTPARNVRFMSTPPIWIRAGESPSEPKEEEWSVADGTFVVFPNDDGLSQSTRPLPVPDQIFSAYSNGTIHVFFWARLSYCDTTGRHHWTQIGVAHLSGAQEFSIRASSTSPDPGETNHPDCQK